MRFVDEYRLAPEVARTLDALACGVTRPWVLMEICGGQTHTFIQSGLDRMLPPGITLVHGPGCPVCVTPVSRIDQAIAIARRPGVILASFGDMLRVPGSGADLLGARAAGADVRMVYSPLEAVRLAERNPGREVVFFAVGFETTAPATAMAAARALRMRLPNFSVLCAHVRVPPAMDALLADPDHSVQGFLAAGHVCTVMGWHEYEPLAARHRVPIVVTGFEPLDLAQGVYLTARMLEEGRIGVENQYARSVTRAGNLPAQRLLAEVFEPCDREWRGIGAIPASGFALRGPYRALDADDRFGLAPPAAAGPEVCIAGAVLRGRARPTDCPAFGTRCTPDHPLGAPMVSSEGACAAYHRYGRVRT